VENAQLQVEQWNGSMQCFSYGRWQHIAITLLGDYQRINAAIALEALQLLQQQEPALTDAVIREGLRSARWPGRFEMVHQQPIFVVDGAHNPAGAQALANTLQQHFAGRRIWLLLGVFGDKDYRQIMKQLRSCSDTIFCFQPQHERGLDVATLVAAAAELYPHVHPADTVEQAVQKVLTLAAPEDVIVSFGSLSTVKAVQEAVQQWEVHHGAC
jgi:dihydrofolate synthase/folylpolyglutamate synthase